MQRTNILTDVFILCLKARLFEYHRGRGMSHYYCEFTTARNTFGPDRQSVFINMQYSFLTIRDGDEIMERCVYLRNASE